ncbi:hypothetical protein THAOC_15434 [Thalassiosira oceanica]|uniref:Uncharacterized protein n=1 Tax=Thalassiosira oceanica TaxID=159749 RepID=K0SEV0_THAOC|nr:hypothetical protein THAOC_15434 [Thalassiosira oceanica]|eukprot:EJK63885.1 hypothetical protein THAOC_15434 [Thalassiosira oceanica]
MAHNLPQPKSNMAIWMWPCLGSSPTSAGFQEKSLWGITDGRVGNRPFGEASCSPGRALAVAADRTCGGGSDPGPLSWVGPWPDSFNDPNL